MPLCEKQALPVWLFGVFVLWIAGSTGVAQSNEYHLRPIARVGGYCGPYNISKVYWVDSGKVVLPDDDPVRNRAWEDCARSYQCSKRIVAGYMQRFGKDCNGDGVTNCFDYMMVHSNGSYGCTTDLNESEKGRLRLQRYLDCGL